MWRRQQDERKGRPTTKGGGISTVISSIIGGVYLSPQPCIIYLPYTYTYMPCKPTAHLNMTKKPTHTQLTSSVVLVRAGINNNYKPGATDCIIIMCNMCAFHALTPRERRRLTCTKSGKDGEQSSGAAIHAHDVSYSIGLVVVRMCTAVGLEL